MTGDFEAVKNQKPLQVLLVEDNAADARLLREMFGKERPDSFVLTHLTRLRDAEAHLAAGGVDIVLLDMGLPDGHGLDTLRRARAAAPGVAIIVLTGLEDEQLAAAAIKEGAQDYLIKGQIENRALPRALRYAIERNRMHEEADVLRAHQLQIRDDFLSHVSHELRSPLTSIYSFSTIIADGLAGEVTAQQGDYLQIILRNVRQLQSMIEDLLEVAQAQSGKLSIDLQPVAVNEAISYAVDTLQGVAIEKEIRLAFDPLPSLPSAYADGTRVRQIMTILLDNAMKFTPAGGAVQVRASVQEKQHGFLLIEVADTGCGIGPEATERIFEHHYQVANDPGRAGRRGLGLGLHIARQLVTRLGGEMWVSSEPGKGSRFFFTLPVFSLTGLLGPILTQERPDEPLAVITLEIDARDGSPDVPKEILERTRAVLQQCLRPEGDVLLPNLGPANEHKLFFVVTRTHEHGAESMRRRILSQLRHHKELEPSDFTFVVAHSFPPPVARDADASTDVYVARVAAGVRERINHICLEGRDSYESKENSGGR
jgi:signal transduction histidine kinase